MRLCITALPSWLQFCKMTNDKILLPGIMWQIIIWLAQFCSLNFWDFLLTSKATLTTIDRLWTFPLNNGTRASCVLLTSHNLQFFTFISHKLGFLTLFLDLFRFRVSGMLDWNIIFHKDEPSIRINSSVSSNAALVSETSVPVLKHCCSSPTLRLTYDIGTFPFSSKLSENTGKSQKTSTYSICSIKLHSANADVWLASDSSSAESTWFN